MRILYIEDNPSNLAFIERVLTMSGDELHTFPDAESVLERGEDIFNYDLIITDIHLGENVMDGLDFTAILRDNGVNVPIIALTAYDFDEYERRSHEAGSDLYVVKPISPQDLMDMLDRFRQ